MSAGYRGATEAEELEQRLDATHNDFSNLVGWDCGCRDSPLQLALSSLHPGAPAASSFSVTSLSETRLLMAT